MPPPPPPAAFGATPYIPYQQMQPQAYVPPPAPILPPVCYTAPAAIDRFARVMTDSDCDVVLCCAQGLESAVLNALAPPQPPKPPVPTYSAAPPPLAPVVPPPQQPTPPKPTAPVCYSFCCVDGLMDCCGSCTHVVSLCLCVLTSELSAPTVTLCASKTRYRSVVLPLSFPPALIPSCSHHSSKIQRF